MTAVSVSESSPRRRPKDRKQQIILQARDLFVERSYPSVSMALIAERLGITAGALYRHFDNKSELLEAVVRESFSYLTDPVVGSTLEQVVDDAIAKVSGHPYVSDLWSSEARFLPEPSRDKLRQEMRDWAHAFIPHVARERPGLDAGQEELIAWGLQSVLAFLGSSRSRASEAARLPVVRSAALSLARADLVPTGARIPKPARVVAPASTRERVLLAAIEQFADRGYQETAMSSIGAAADVTGPNLYGYFESKADLLRAVHDRGHHAMWLNLEDALSRAGSVEEALEQLVAGHVRLARTWSQFRVDVTGEDEIAELTAASQREYVAEWVALLRAIEPRLEARTARLRVLIAMKVMNDLSRTHHLSAYSSFPDNLAGVVLAILRGA